MYFINQFTIKNWAMQERKKDMEKEAGITAKGNKGPGKGTDRQRAVTIRLHALEGKKKL